MPKWYLLLLTCFVVLVVGAVACGGEEERPGRTNRNYAGISQPTSTPADTANIRAAALSGCPHFYNIFADLTDGLLTEYELREKFGEVYDNFVLLRTERDLESQRVYEGARALYASVTPPMNADEALVAIEGMMAICEQYG